MSMGGSNNFLSRIGEVAATGYSPAPSPGGKGGVTTPEQPVDFYQSAMPTTMDFYNQGSLVDPTLLAQQAILGRQPTAAYQPLVTPESYQNFYYVPAANTRVIPNYRDLAATFKKEAAAAPDAVSSYGGDGGYGPSAGGSSSVDLNDMSSLAPVTDAITGESSPGAGAAIGMAPGVTGQSFSAEGDSAPGGGECFVASTMVTDSDGVEKPISEFKIGDYVLSTDGMTYNKVKYVETSQTKRGEIIWSPDGREPFATYNHPMMVGDKWVSCDQKVTDQRYPWVKAVQASKPNTKMSDGETVYNLWVEGDGTYFVNGFATTSLIGDGGLMRVAIEQGIITEDDSRTIIHFTQRGSVIDMYGVHHLNLMLGKWNIKPLNKYACDVMLGKRNSLIAGLAIKAVGLVTALADGVRIKFDRKSTQNATA